MNEIRKVDGLTLLNPFVQTYFLADPEVNELPAEKYFERWNKFVDENEGVIKALNESYLAENSSFVNEAKSHGCSDESISLLTEMKVYPSKNADAEDEDEDEEDEYGVDDYGDEDLEIDIDDLEDNNNDDADSGKERLYNKISNMKSMRTVRDKKDSYYNDIHCLFGTLYENMKQLGNKIGDERVNSKGQKEKITVNMTNKGHCLVFSLFDTSKVHNMSALFAFMEIPNADLTKFDVRGCINAQGMFFGADFGGTGIEYWKWSAMERKIGSYDWDTGQYENEAEAISSSYYMFDMFAECTFRKYDILRRWIETSNGRLSMAVDAIWENVGYEPNGDVFSELYDEFPDLAESKKENINNFVMENNTQNGSVRPLGYRIMTADEFVNEGLRDTIRKVGNKIKGLFSNLAVKLKNGLIVLFDKDGNALEANSIDSVLGALAESNKSGIVVNDYIDKPGYYGECDATEIGNYNAMLKYLSQAGPVNERRIAMHARQEDEATGQRFTNIGCPDVNDEQLDAELRKAWRNLMKSGFMNKGVQPPICIFGAPGVGKTTIVKRTAKHFIENQTTFIEVDCSLLTADGFDLPLSGRPESMGDFLNNQMPEVKKELLERAKEAGISAEDIANNLAIQTYHSSTAPKTWLPVWRPTGNPNTDRFLDDVCNSRIGEKNGEYSAHTEGGVLFYDELLRIKKPDLLFSILNMGINRKFKEDYRLGSKWLIVYATNRPTESKTVRDNMKLYGESALWSRMVALNFVPDFRGWKNWAIGKDGPFNTPDGKTIIEWIEKTPIDGDDSRFHRQDTEDTDEENMEMRTVNPRRWEHFMKDALESVEMHNEEHPNDKYTDIGDLGQKELLYIARKFFPDGFAEDFVKGFMTLRELNPVSYEEIAKKGAKIRVRANQTSVGNANHYIQTIRSAWDDMIEGKKKVPAVPAVANCFDFLCINFPMESSIIAKFYLDYVDDVIMNKVKGVRTKDGGSMSAEYFRVVFEGVLKKHFPELGEQMVEDSLQKSSEGLK